MDVAASRHPSRGPYSLWLLSRPQFTEIVATGVSLPVAWARMPQQTQACGGVRPGRRGRR